MPIHRIEPEEVYRQKDSNMVWIDLSGMKEQHMLGIECRWLGMLREPAHSPIDEESNSAVRSCAFRRAVG